MPLLLHIIFYYVPFMLIAYALFLFYKASPKPTMGIVITGLLLIIPSLLMLHFAFIVTEANKKVNMERFHLRNGTYINVAYRDTIKLVDDSLYLFRFWKKDTTVYHSRGEKNPDNIATEYIALKDTIDIMQPGWDSVRFKQNIRHYFKKAPLDINGTERIRIGTYFGYKYKYYDLTVDNDTLELNIGPDETQPIKYVKLTAKADDKPAATK